jgi:hypothetical protein
MSKTWGGISPNVETSILSTAFGAMLGAGTFRLFELRHYAEGLIGGWTIVTVQAPGREGKAEEILHQHGAHETGIGQVLPSDWESERPTTAEPGSDNVVILASTDAEVPRTPSARMVERTASADFPPTVQSGSDNLLTYAISNQTIVSERTARLLMDVPPGTTKLALTVVVHTSDFLVLDPKSRSTQNFRDVEIDLLDDHSEVFGQFLLRAPSAEIPIDGMITLRFLHEGLPVGQIPLPTVIEPIPVSPQAATSASRGSSVTGELHVSWDAPPPPHIVIYVDERDDGKYEIFVDRHRGAGRFLHRPMGEFPTTGKAWDYAQALLNRFRLARDLKPQERQSRIDGLGLELWWNLPAEFRNFYWEGIHGQELSLVVYSKEPYIPWELVKPQVKKGVVSSAPMLGLAFSITRWSQGIDFPDPLRVSDFVVVTPEYSDQPLPEAQLEAKDLIAEFGARALQPPTYGSVTHMLQSRGIQLVHFSGHGNFNPLVATESQIRLSDAPLLPTDLYQAELGLSDRPLVFLNACEVGQEGWSLTQIGGWAHAFCSIGCTAFVGPYWAVNDRVAHKAALVFYRALRDKKTIGQAMQAVRQRFLNDDEFRSHPTWLAYTAHCQPNVTVDLPH